MDELMGEFVAETRETLEAIAGEIVAWEAAPDDRKRLDSIFRFVHTVKGSCGFLDLPRLERLSHAAEDALATVRAGERVPDHRLASAVLAIIDRIGGVVEAIAAGGTLPDHDDDRLIAALHQSCAEQPAEAPAPADGAAEAEVAFAAAPSTLVPRAPARSIRLPIELLDRMMSGVSDMVLARNELARQLRELDPGNAADAAFDRLSTCVAEMRDAITRTRMQRIDNLFTALPRLVRDVSSELGKAVVLEIDGGDVELDREMIEMIRDPLTHIVRNAIDHGFEPPADRLALGKPSQGLLRVRAVQSGNQILIEVADDGRGINADRLVAKAVAAGVLTADRAEALPWSGRLQLIFEPGLSTAASVSSISGRGVGMDVVRANVERIGGTVDVESRPGAGTRLTMLVPLTLTIIPALTVSAGGHQFAIPRSAIEEIVRSGSGAVHLERIGELTLANIRGRRLPIVTLAAILGAGGEGDGPAQQTLVVLKPAGREMFALAVDTVHDHEELVVKPAAPAVMAIGIYAGTTLPDNGRPMLLLDPGGLARAGGVASEGESVPDAAHDVAPAAELVPMLLFRDLDGTVRAIRLAVVERIEDAAADALADVAGRLRLVVDGRIVPVFATARPGAGRHRTLRIGDGHQELAYVIDEVLDIVELVPELRLAASPGFVAGAMLVRDRPVEVLDPFWLFASIGERGFGAPQDRPLCLLRGGEDGWARDILRPLIEQAGYRVTADAAEEPGADVVVLDAAADAGEATGDNVVRLRLTPASVPGEDSIYRYDRQGLLAAVSNRARARRE